jgi:hypothetical protein
MYISTVDFDRSCIKEEERQIRKKEKRNEEQSYTLGICHSLVVVSVQELIRPLAGPYALMLHLHQS